MKKTVLAFLISLFFICTLSAAVETGAETQQNSGPAVTGEQLVPSPASQGPEASAPDANAGVVTANDGELPANGQNAEKGTFHFAKMTLDAPENALITRYINEYTSPDGIKYLSAVMKRSGMYREYIMKEIERQEVPECLLYLPVIESGFSTTAVSHSGATGLWQFMKNSMGCYGIRTNEWMDERKDPWITSVAAIRKLKENYNDLGDWYLALAAYNCGLGATRIAVKKAGVADYWYLSKHGFLKPETVQYIPKFIAIATILSKSDEYGIDWGDSTENSDLITIPVKRPVDISVLAKETGLDPVELKKINPALYYYITPPDSAYSLRIPANQQTQIEAVLADKTKMLLEYYMYKIKSGDTLYALALHYGISMDMILQYNPGVKASALKIGKNLVIPAIKEVGAYKGKQDPDNLDFSGSYLVKQGDTLWSIALAYNIQVETLADKNNIEVNTVLKLGKQLHVPIL